MAMITNVAVTACVLWKKPEAAAPSVASGEIVEGWIVSSPLTPVAAPVVSPPPLVRLEGAPPPTTSVVEVGPAEVVDGGV